MSSNMKYKDLDYTNIETCVRGRDIIDVTKHAQQALRSIRLSAAPAAALASVPKCPILHPPEGPFPRKHTHYHTRGHVCTTDDNLQ